MKSSVKWQRRSGCKEHIWTDWQRCVSELQPGHHGVPAARVPQGRRCLCSAQELRGNAPRHQAARAARHGRRYRGFWGWLFKEIQAEVPERAVYQPGGAQRVLGVDSVRRAERRPMCKCEHAFYKTRVFIILKVKLQSQQHTSAHDFNVYSDYTATCWGVSSHSWDK